MPYFRAKCTHCGKLNDFETVSLHDHETGYRDAREPQIREYYVTCQHCLKPFKIKTRGEADDEKK